VAGNAPALDERPRRSIEIRYNRRMLPDDPPRQPNDPSPEQIRRLARELRRRRNVGKRIGSCHDREQHVGSGGPGIRDYSTADLGLEWGPTWRS
jgi:hypothetical protein